MRRTAFAMLGLVAVVVLAPSCYIKADSSRIVRASHIVIEIGYVTGAEPVASPAAANDPWPVVRNHLDRVFLRTAPTIEFIAPVLLADPPSNLLGATFSLGDAVDFAKHVRTVQSTGDTAAFYVLILPGNFDRTSNGRNYLGLTNVGDAVSVLSQHNLSLTFALAAETGVSFGLTPDESASLIEQICMTHEISHAIGLVDSGVSMVHDHSAPSGHCSTATCLMAPDLSLWPSFRTVAANPTAILYDDACLADIDHE